MTKLIAALALLGLAACETPQQRQALASGLASMGRSLSDGGSPATPVNCTITRGGYLGAPAQGWSCQ